MVFQVPWEPLALMACPAHHNRARGQWTVSKSGRGRSAHHHLPWATFLQASFLGAQTSDPWRHCASLANFVGWGLCLAGNMVPPRHRPPTGIPEVPWETW